MKELSIEQKAKRYDEAIKKFDVILNLNTVKESGTIFADDVRKIFPELAEPEDEKIRKELIHYLQDAALYKAPMYKGAVYSAEEAVAWLEKQGEQKHADMVEQKPTLEDAAKAFLEALSETPYNNTPIVEAQIITKQLLIFLSEPKSYTPDAINEQKLAWSEEDESTRKALSNLVGMYYLGCTEKLGRDRLLNWLNSLEGRVQPQWKPSAEQMEALENAIRYGEEESIGILSLLYNDLKKLREE